MHDLPPWQPKAWPSFRSDACMQVIEHDDEEAHASFSPLSTGASLRSFQGTPLAAAREEALCTRGQDTSLMQQQGRQCTVKVHCKLRTVTRKVLVLQISAHGS